MSRQRRSLRDRDEFAISDTNATNDTNDTESTDDTSDATTADVRRPDGYARPEASRASTSPTSTSPTSTSPTSRSSVAGSVAGSVVGSVVGAGETQRFGIYFRSVEAFDDAKSAYLSDWEQLSDSADTFAGWVANALHAHARRTPEQRATIAQRAEEQPLGTRSTRTFIIEASARAAAVSALNDDGRAGRWGSLSQFGGEAIAAAVEGARGRTGGTLPPAPARLPNRLHR